MNEIKYSQKACRDILLKAERIRNKYLLSLVCDYYLINY